jgi:uncharacterized membrane protein
MNRYLSVDVLRGLIMVIMAIDHSLGAWSITKNYLPEAGLPFAGPGPTNPYTVYADPATEFSRVITHVCAPGFQLLAGLGLAISVARSRKQGVSELRITGDMILRGIILILCDWYVMRFAYGNLPYIWLVLCCIGAATILFSVLRFWPLPLIGVFSAALLVLAPYYCPKTLEVASAENYFTTLWCGVAFGPSFTVMYPIFPWAGLFGLGWVLGTIYESRPLDRFQWLIPLGIVLMLLGLGLRWFGGTYGDRMPGGEGGPFTLQFWVWSKYPPSPTFSIATLGWLLLMLGLFRTLDMQPSPSPRWQYLAILGRVALFFFVVHFFFYGLTWLAYTKLHEHFWYDPAFLDRGEYKAKVSLATSYVIWVIGLLVVWPMCRWYDKLRQKHRKLLRYF